MTPEQIQQLRQQYGYNPSSLTLPSQESDVQSDEVNKRLQTVFGGGEEAKPQEGMLARLAKDAASVAVRPTVRTTEAVTRTLFPNSMAAKGFESYADTNEPVQSGVFGIEVPQVGTGTDAARQIAGETAQSAAYLLPYGKVASAVSPVVGNTLGNVAAGTLGGYLADTGTGLQDKNQTLGEAMTPGLGTAIGAAIPAAPALLQGAGRLTAKAGSKVIESVIPTSSIEAKLLKNYRAENPFFTRIANVLSGTEKAPQTAAKTITETSAGQKINGLFGTKSQIGVQATRASRSLWKDLIEPRLKNAGVQVDLPKYFDTVEQSIINSTDDITRQNSLKEALNAIREDYAGVQTIDLAKLQKLKEGWAEFVPEKFYKGQNIAGNVRQVQALLADEARQTIYNTLGKDVKQAYLDYGNLIGIQEMGEAAMTGQKLKGGAGSFLSELFSEVVTPVGTVGGQVVYRLGKGMEVIGNAGAKVLGDVLGVSGKANQEFKAPIKTQTAQTPTTNKIISNMPDTIPQSTKGASGKMSGFVQLTKDIPKELQPLAEEARKYKSAEEFVNAQGKTVYHGTDSDSFVNLDPSKAKKGETYFNPLGDGFYVSSDKDFTSNFGRNTYEYVLPKEAKTKVITDGKFLKNEYPTAVSGTLKKLGIKDSDLSSMDKAIIADIGKTNTPIQALNEVEFLIRDEISPRLGLKLKDNEVKDIMQKIMSDRNSKYDAVIYKTTNDLYGEADEIIVNPDSFSKLKTKQQLIDLYNKVNGKQGGFADLGILPKIGVGAAAGVGALKAEIEYKKSKNK